MGLCNYKLVHRYVVLGLVSILWVEKIDLVSSRSRQNNTRRTIRATGSNSVNNGESFTRDTAVALTHRFHRVAEGVNWTGCTRVRRSRWQGEAIGWTSTEIVAWIKTLASGTGAVWLRGIRYFTIGALASAEVDLTRAELCTGAPSFEF